MNSSLIQHSGLVTYNSSVNGAVARPLNKHAPTRRPYLADNCSTALYSVRGTTATLCPSQPSQSPYHTKQSAKCPAAAPTATVSISSPVQQPLQQQQQQQQTALRGLYPPTTAHQGGYLKVSELHTIYYEVHGNPAGVPAVVVHGGPGAGCYPNHARFFDPQHYRIVLLDQRGCGRSTPTGCLEDNTTAALVSDLDTLRRHLNIQQWLLLGGSWGVALSIAYAQAHPQAVLGLVLRGVCLMRPSEIQWMFGGGAAALRPLAWRKFLEQLEVGERGNPLLGYYKRFLSLDASVRQAAAKAWMAWEMAVGFNSSQDLLLWDGHHWAAQPAPAAAAAAAVGQQQLLLPPPAPKSAAAAAAAAAAAGGSGGWPMLQRGGGLPTEVLDGASSSSISSSSSKKQGGIVRRHSSSKKLSQQNLTVSAADVGSVTSKRCSNSSSRPSNSSSSSSSGSSSIHPALGPSGLAAASDQVQVQQQQQQSAGWVRDLPDLGFNTQDPEVQTLIHQGLNHRGFTNSGAAQALLECHYSLHGAFLLAQPLLDHIERVRHIPCIAVQGQLDYVCPPVSAVELSESWPEIELRLIPGAGHSMYDPAITHELVCATDRMRGLTPQQQQQRGVLTPATTAAAVGRKAATVRRVNHH